jgi:hypothetical protein
MTVMVFRITTLLVTLGYGVFVASCSPGADVLSLKHPTLSPAEQTAVRNACALEAQGRLGSAPPASSPAPCREDGDASARDRCRAQADLALVAEARYVRRLDSETAACLRAKGFVD